MPAAYGTVLTIFYTVIFVHELNNQFLKCELFFSCLMVLWSVLVQGIAFKRLNLVL